MTSDMRGARAVLLQPIRQWCRIPQDVAAAIGRDTNQPILPMRGGLPSAAGDKCKMNSLAR